MKSSPLLLTQIEEPGGLGSLEDSSDLISRPAELRSRASRDGFLFFRGLLDPEPLLDLRVATLNVINHHGLRAPNATGLSGKLNLARLNELPAEEMRVDIGVTRAMYFELQRIPELHRLPHDPSLIGLYRGLLNSEIFVHPRHIMRAMTPHPATGATPPHQDFPLIQGSPETWTCWFPLGDCSLDLGPLAVLRGSHMNGYLPVGTGDKDGHWTDWGAQLCERETDWVSTNFKVGDVLTFPSFTVHRSLRPVIRDEIRLSMDVRYQRASDPIEAKSLTNHSDREWSEVYEGWPREAEGLRYYWTPNKLSISPWDEFLMLPSTRRIC